MCLPSALAVIHTQMCAQARRKFPSSLAQLLHYMLSYLFVHVPHGEPGFDMVQLKIHINDKLLA